MNHGKDSPGSRMSRRQFLQTAAMGIAAVQLAPVLRPTPATRQHEEIEIIGGTLATLGDGWLEIQEEERLRRIVIDWNTSFWKGGESTPGALMKGDDILIRALAERQLALRVWSNLSRVGGVVIRVAEKGYVLRVGDLHTPEGELMLEVSERTLFSDYMTHSPAEKDKGLISEGDYVDAIGERIPEGLRGTLVYHYDARRDISPPETMPQVQGADEVERVISPESYCTYSYLGYAGWFNCPTGAGRCGTCSTSRSDQAAWPALDTCGCCSPTCCDCSKGCKNQVYLWCGKNVTVFDSCQAKSRTVYIASCGPCQKNNCAGCPPGTPDLCARICGWPDCLNRQTAVIDLTKPTFAWFGYDPAARGCFSCKVSVTIPCPPP